MRKKNHQKHYSQVFKEHNHNRCFEVVMKTFQNHCLKKNLKVTPLRNKVLECLLKGHQSLGAYQILDLLRQAGFSSTPPIAYRVLNFLIEHGFVHKIERFNTFIACSHPGNFHSPAFMICRKCDKVAEIDEKECGIDLKKATPVDFKVEEAVIEMIGICTSCITTEVSDAH